MFSNFNCKQWNKKQCKFEKLAIICAKVDLSLNLQFRDEWTLLHFWRYVICHFQSQVNYFLLIFWRSIFFCQKQIFLIARYFSFHRILASLRNVHASHSKCTFESELSEKPNRINKIYLKGLLIHLSLLRSKILYVTLRIQDTADQNVQFRFSYVYIMSIRHEPYFQILPETYRSDTIFLNWN